MSIHINKLRENQLKLKKMQNNQRQRRCNMGGQVVSGSWTREGLLGFDPSCVIGSLPLPPSEWDQVLVARLSTVETSALSTCLHWRQLKTIVFGGNC